MTISIKMMYITNFLLLSAFPFNCIIHTESAHPTKSINSLVILKEKLHLKTSVLSFIMVHLQMNIYLCRAIKIIKAKIYFLYTLWDPSITMTKTKQRNKQNETKQKSPPIISWTIWQLLAELMILCREATR